MKLINFQDGTKVSDAYVNESGNIVPAVYTGATPFSAYVMNLLQSNIQDEFNKISNILSNPKETVTGENITINDSAEARVEEIHIRGNSVQSTRSGKNLLKIKNFENKTINGVTFTAKYDVDGNLEYINATGNSTTGYMEVVRVNISNLPAGNYIINGLETNSVVRFVLLKADDKEPKTITNNADISFIQDTSSPYTTFRIDLCSAGEVNIKMKPMIRPASITDNSYEPYGVMPSPDYPSKINSCGDNVNLFDKDNLKDNVWINTEQGGTVSNTSAYITNDIYLKKGQTIFIPNCGTSRWGYWNIDKTTFTYMGTGGDRTFTALIDCIVLVSVLKSTVTPDKLKIEKGSKLTPYTPHNQGCINETICNKNIFKLKESNYSALGISVITNNNTLILNGTTNASGNLLPTYGKKDYHILLGKFKAGTYTFSLKTSGSWSGSKNFAFYIKDFNDAFLSTITENEIKNNSATYTFTLDEDKDLYLLAFVNSANMIFNNYTVDFQLEENTVSTEYVEHIEQTYTIPTQKPFRAIGDYKDIFVKQDGVWYEKHYIGEVILVGTETWQTQGTNTSGINRMQCNDYNSLMQISSSVLCSHYESKTTSETYQKIQGFSISNAGNIQIYDETYNSNISDFKTWLISNNVTVNYLLKTPELIPCTTEQIIKLNEIQALAKTYKNTTHIYSEDEVSPEIEVTYYKDLETMLNNA